MKTIGTTQTLKTRLSTRSTCSSSWTPTSVTLLLPFTAKAFLVWQLIFLSSWFSNSSSSTVSSTSKRDVRSVIRSKRSRISSLNLSDWPEILMMKLRKLTSRCTAKLRNSWWWSQLPERLFSTTTKRSFSLDSSLSLQFLSHSPLCSHSSPTCLKS